MILPNKKPKIGTNSLTLPTTQRRTDSGTLVVPFIRTSHPCYDRYDRWSNIITITRPKPFMFSILLFFPLNPFTTGCNRLSKALSSNLDRTSYAYLKIWYTDLMLPLHQALLYTGVKLFFKLNRHLQLLGWLSSPIDNFYLKPPVDVKRTQS